MKKTIPLIITAIIFTGIGIYLSPYVMKQMDTSPSSSTNQTDTYEAGWEAARQRLIDNGLMTDPPANEPSNIVNGIITSIDTDLIMIDTHPQNLLADPKLKDRTIFLQEETIFTSKNIKEETSTEISLDDLIIGQPIEVLAIETIEDQTEITPVEIILYDFTGMDEIPDLLPTDET